MPSLYGLFGLLKKLAILILIVAIATPIRYESTDPVYLAVRLFHSILSCKHWLLSDRARPTLSVEYRAFEDMIRMYDLPVDDPSTDLDIAMKNLRSSCTMGNIIPKPSQCQVNKEVFEHDGHSVDTYWIDYPTRKFQTKSDKLLLYFHGGAYILGDINSYSGLECHLSQLFNISVLHIEYRLSPEHPLPAAVDDGVAIYRALLRNNISPSQLLFMGDSAGGGLALLTIQAIIAHQLPVPAGVIVLSPWTDISLSVESHTRNRHIDVALNWDHLSRIPPLLLGPNHSQLSAKCPTVSPLFGSFEGFPPMYVTVGTTELVEDDARGVVKKAQDAGINVIFEEGLHLMHVYPVFFTYFPEARNSLDNINKWIQTIFTEKHIQ